MPGNLFSAVTSMLSLPRFSDAVPSWSKRLSIGLCAAVAGTTLISASLLAQTAGTGSIAGRVLNSATGAYLANVRITVEGSTRETVTDQNGEYRLSNVPAVATRLRATYIGLDEKTEIVSVQPGQIAQRDFELARRGPPPSAAGKEIVQMAEFTVIEQREVSAQALALNEQRQAPNIKNVVAFDEYPKGFDDSLAYFLRFIPGAGGTSSVRALPGDMGIITIDGAEITGVLTGQTRAAGLNVVPVNNISRIEVTKVPTPDMPANLGGTINVISRSGFERTRPEFRYNVFTAWFTDLGTSWDKIHGPLPGLSERTLLPSFEFNYAHPIKDKLAVTVNVSQQDSMQRQDGSISTWNHSDYHMDAINSTWTAVHQTTKNARIGVDWKITRRDLVSASLHYRDRVSSQYEQGLRLQFGGGATGGANSVTGAAAGNGNVAQTMSALRLDSDSRLALVKYEHKGDIWRINAGMSDSYSRSFYGSTNNGFMYTMNASLPNLRINAAGINAASDPVERTKPQSVTAANRSGVAVDLRDGRNLVISSVGTTYPAFHSNKTEYKFDIGRDWDAKIPISAKVGGMIQPYNSKGANAGARTYNFRPGETEAVRTARNYDLIDVPYSSQGPVYAGAPVMWISPVKLQQLFLDHPEHFVQDLAATHTNRVNNSRKLEETISAAFVRVDARLFNNRLWLVGGVRYERTDDEGWGVLNDPTAQYVKDSTGKVAKNAAGQPTLITTDPLQRAYLRFVERGSHAERSYDGYYPSLNVTFNIRDDLVLRAGYAKTVGRPPITQIVPSVSIPDVSSSTSGRISVNNTGLEPWSATSYDLSLESYLFKGVTASVSVFQKDIVNFFTTTIQNATPELLDQYGISGGDANTIYEISTLGNGGDATMKGIEIAYKQNLTFLPDWARGFQVFANWTKRELSGSRTADFSGFFPSNISWGVNFVRPRYAVRFSSTYREELRGPLRVQPDIYDWSRANLSYQASVECRIGKHLEVYATWQDFNDKDSIIGLKQFNAKTPDYAKDRQTLAAGPKAVVGIRGEF
ncbi:MAG: TonB-dependent receptor [Verrucomicrobia bacterium]|nr:TonB-dependent receptor [Verrucomicrobiota bacterium]